MIFRRQFRGALATLLQERMGMRATSAADILRVIKEQLAEKLSRPKYELLIRPLHPLAFDEESQGEPVLRGWLLEQYGELISELATLVVGTRVNLEVDVAAPGKQQDFTSEGASKFPAGAATPDPNDLIDFPPNSAERAPIRKPLLNPRY